MKVFISWSGDRSQQYAEAIHWWLRKVLQFTRPFFTPVDVDKGKRWNNEISKELGQSQFGIIAMTRDNLESPWIMFEAGAISKVVEEARVCPIVFGGIRVTDLVGPLADFQAIEFNRTRVRQLLTSINNAAPKEVTLTDRDLDEAFNMWWTELETRVEAISTTAQPPSGPRRTPEDLLEEVVSNTRAILRELEQLQPERLFIPTADIYDAAAQRRYGGLGGLGGLAPGPLGVKPPPVRGEILDPNNPSSGGLAGGTVPKSE